MSDRHDENDAVRYEKEDINERSTFWFGLIILIVMVAAALLTKPLYDLLAERETAAQPAAAYVAESDPRALEPPSPRLQVHPETDLAAFRAQEEATLTTYAWVDKENGIVRIPVQEAMRIVAERGLPVFPEEETEDPEEEDPS
jgi:hypothetical protein